MKSIKFLFLDTPLIPGCIIAALIFLAFGSVLKNSFVYDDFPVLVNNPHIKSPPGVIQLLTDPGFHTASDEVKTYRPLRTAFFSLQHIFFHLDPRPYHAVSLVMHFAVSLMLYLFLQNFFRRETALTAAAVFSCHPIHTEVLASVKSQDDLLAAFFVIAGLLLYSHRPTACHDIQSIHFWVLQVVFLSACLSKENAIVFPAMIWLTSRGLLKISGKTKKIFNVYLGMIVTGFAFYLLRSHAFIHAYTGTVQIGKPVWLFCSSLAYVPMYWALSFFPKTLRIDYSFLPAVTCRSAVFTGSIVFQTIVALAVLRTRNKKSIYCFCWTYFFLLPSLNILPGYVIFAERFYYLPLAGTAVLVVYTFEKLIHRFSFFQFKSCKSLYLFFSILIIPLLIRSHDRTMNWRDNETLFRAELEIAPESEIIRNFLASELIKTDRSSEAAEYLPEIPVPLGSQPVTSLDRSRLALQAVERMQQGEFEKAAVIFEGISRSKYMTDNDWRNYGISLINLGKLESAETCFENILERSPEDVTSLRMKGIIRLKKGRWKDAIPFFEKVLKNDPRNPSAWFYLIFATSKTDGAEAAVSILKQALERKIDIDGPIRQQHEFWEQVDPAVISFYESRVKTLRTPGFSETE